MIYYNFDKYPEAVGKYKLTVRFENCNDVCELNISTGILTTPAFKYLDSMVDFALRITTLPVTVQHITIDDIHFEILPYDNWTEICVYTLTEDRQHQDFSYIITVDELRTLRKMIDVMWLYRETEYFFDSMDSDSVLRMTSYLMELISKLNSEICRITQKLKDYGGGLKLMETEDIK